MMIPNYKKNPRSERLSEAVLKGRRGQITNKQAQLLRYLIGYRMMRGNFPTMREMVVYMGWSCIGQASEDALSALEAKGYIARGDPRGHRQVTILKGPDGEPWGEEDVDARD